MSNAKSVQKRAEKEILANLEVLGGKIMATDDIIFQGEKLIVPERMTLRELSKFIARKVEEDEEETYFSRVFDYRPWDGAWCMINALNRLFGAVGHGAKVIQTFFGEMREPPQMITIQTGVGKNEQIPWGQFTLPFLPEVWFETGQFEHETKGSLFVLSARGAKRNRFRIEGVFNAIQAELETNSLYRGKAIDGQDMPEFVDVFSVDKNKVIYSEKVMGDLDSDIWAQLRHPEQFEGLEIPFKRAVLIHGPFGTGKTLACLLTGQEAVSNGYTFIRVRPGKDNLSKVLATARLYDPCVVFCEDVDQHLAHEGMTMAQLLDDFDGIEAKGAKILCVLTTNYPEKIPESMSRPGRIDSFIEINDLDLIGVRKLIESVIGDSLAEEVDWDAVFAAAHGYKPAFVTEAASRTARRLISKYGTVEGHPVGTEELVAAADSLRDQFNRMNGTAREPSSDPMELALKRVVTQTVRENIQERVLAPENGK